MINENNIKTANERIVAARDQNSYFLDLRGLGLTEIPSDISDMIQLMEIDLSYNFFTEIPEMVCKMTSLHKINISHNHVGNINFIFGEYYFLTTLDISYNFLYEIPESLANLNNTCFIKFDCNPFLKNLHGLSDKYDIWTIKSYLELLKVPDNREKLYETKLIFVGRGEVGKTTLMKSIKNSDFTVVEGDEKPTHGINIDHMSFDVIFPATDTHYTHLSEIDTLYREVAFDEDPVELQEQMQYERNGSGLYEDVTYTLYDLDPIDQHLITSDRYFGKEYHISKNVITHLWDFGGQEIYYSTHQFFLTKRSIYIFLWEPRRDEHIEDFEYWLNTVKLLGENSPVLVVMNKCDLRHYPINEKGYLSYFPNIQGFYQISCLTKEGINTLQNGIIESLKTLPHLGAILPKSWQKLRRSLHLIQEDYINYTLFKKLCAENGVSGEKIELQLVSDYLHDVGDIIHFSRDGNLKNLVIINPKWATKAVYSLIDSIPIQKQNGIFHFSELESYLDLDNYPVETHHQLLQLMEKFAICFKVVGEQNRYIIPELLIDLIPNEQELEKIIKDNGLNFKISFSFMPKGLINKLICKLYYLLTTNNYWKNGVVFNYENSQAYVSSENLKKSIEIKIIGSSNRDLFAIIRNELLQIYAELNLKENQDYFEEIPCNCDICKNSKAHYFKYSVLKRYFESNRDIIICDNSLLDVGVSELIDLYRNTKTGKKIIYDIISAVSTLQGVSASIQPDENSRNTYIASILAAKGIVAKDQSLWGRSSTGSKQGELDMKIEDENGNIVTIFEGLNLTSVNSTTIDSHIVKTIVKYDVNGLSENYLGVYYTGRNFNEFSNRYFEHMNKFKQKEIEFSEIIDQSEQLAGCSEIRVYRSFYEKSGRKLSLVHILANML